MKTVIHVMRHGEVDNPDGILYGRLPGYGLTDLIKTNDNPYGYHPARNNCHLFLLTVGYTIPIKHILKSTR